MELAHAYRDLVLAGPTAEALAAARAAVHEAEANLRYAEEALVRQTPTAPGATILQLVDRGSLTLTVFIPQDQLGLVALGHEAEIRVDSYPQLSFTGAVTRLTEQSQFTPSTVLTEEERVKLVYAVEITIADPGHQLLPGMPADASIFP